MSGRVWGLCLALMASAGCSGSGLEGAANGGVIEDVEVAECSERAECPEGMRCAAEGCVPEREGVRAATATTMPTPRANLPPEITIEAPLEGALFQAGEEILLHAQVSDDGLATSLAVAWSTNRGGSLGNALVDTEGKATLSLNDLVAGRHTLTVKVTDPEGLWRQASVEITVEGRPSRPVLRISPENPTVADELSVLIIHGASDANRAEARLTYRYRWFVDQQERLDLKGPTVPAIATLRGQTWTVKVAASDPYGFGDEGFASVEVGNATPTCPEAFILPALADTTTSLTCLCSGREELDQGDPNQDSCRFYDDDTLIAEVPSDNGACVLGAALTERGMSIRCELIPEDPYGAGEPALSAPVLIDNAHPSAPVARLSPNVGGVSDGFSCELIGESSDADGDNVTYEAAWFVNGYPNAPPNPGEVMPIDLYRDGEGNLARGGDTLTCQLVARDAVGEVSLPGVSEAIEIGNTPPFGGQCQVTPTEGVTATSVLTCSPSGASDLDEDPISWNFAWTVTGPGPDPESFGGAIAIITTYPPVTGPKLSGYHFQRDAKVSCVATPSDGQDEGAPIFCGEPVEVANTLPTIWEVLLDPSGEVGMDQPVTCNFYGWSDPDEIDPVEVRYSWLRIADTEISIAEEGSDGFGDTIIPSEAGLVPGDIFTCIARPFNGPDEGEGTYATHSATVVAEP